MSAPRPAVDGRLDVLRDDPFSLLGGLSGNASLELPPLHDTISLPTLGRPSPLEPNASANEEAHAGKSQLSSSHRSNKNIRSRRRQSPARLLYGNEDVRLAETEGQSSHHATSGKKRRAASPVGLALEDFLNDVDDMESPVPLKGSQKTDVETQSWNDFVQLPQPAQKSQKATKPLRFVTVAGLGRVKPALPETTTLPPIRRGKSPGRDGRLAFLDDPVAGMERDLSGDTDPMADQIRIKSRQKLKDRPRKKWSDQETQDLLQGVHKYGIGNWKRIMKDPAFTFYARTSVDLKDRFRTCCPEEYRKHVNARSEVRSTPSAPPESPIKGSPSPYMDPGPNDQPSSTPESTAERYTQLADGPRSKSRRFNSSDLARLGVSGPFPKGNRRQRRPFTDPEDANLLRGYMTHGPCWSKIQADPSLCFDNRKATDLRDRFRNRYPERYREAGFKTRPESWPKPPTRSEAGPREGSSLDQRSSDDGKGEAASQGQSRGPMTLATRSANTSEENLPGSPFLLNWESNNLPPIIPAALPPTNNPPERPDAGYRVDHIHPLLTYKNSGSSKTATPPSHLDPLPSKPSQIPPPTLQDDANLLPRRQTLPLRDLDAATTTNRGMPSFPHLLLRNTPPMAKRSLHHHQPPPPTNRGESTAAAVGPDPSSSCGDRTPTASMGLLWEDMATHPMFDIDGGGVEKGSGGVGGT
ncbi:MAG: hypothetical protein M1817_001437 [Caeruleum heppii]|nr:MAG: hypothetical protein M1817_001437 [Caeruleum heppii]